jgi:glutathione synthase/RimK-type ligase-like ATP-grasp enzyme
VHELPVETADRCRRLVGALGLTYGAIDLIVTTEGDYVLLEVNPAGQYLWLEEAAQLPITEAVCDFLCATDDLKEASR